LERKKKKKWLRKKQKEDPLFELSEIDIEIDLSDEEDEDFLTTNKNYSRRDKKKLKQAMKRRKKIEKEGWLGRQGKDIITREMVEDILGGKYLFKPLSPEYLEQQKMKKRREKLQKLQDEEQKRKMDRKIEREEKRKRKMEEEDKRRREEWEIQLSKDIDQKFAPPRPTALDYEQNVDLHGVWKRRGTSIHSSQSGENGTRWTKEIDFELTKKRLYTPLPQTITTEDIMKRLKDGEEAKKELDLLQEYMKHKDDQNEEEKKKEVED